MEYSFWTGVKFIFIKLFLFLKKKLYVFVKIFSLITVFFYNQATKIHTNGLFGQTDDLDFSGFFIQFFYFSIFSNKDKPKNKILI